MKSLLKNLILESPPALALGITIIAHLLFFLEINVIVWFGLIISFITVGLSHGAIDYLADAQVKSNSDLIKFIGFYILKAIAFATLWYFFPDYALVFFIIFSVWHFGQTDFDEWKLPQGFLSTIWGIIVLLLILIFHFQETLSVLRQIPNLKIVFILENINASQLLYLKYGIFAIGVLFCGVINNRKMWIALTYITLSIPLPLLVSFGIYFIFQHSLHGWKHLKKKLSLSSTAMLWNALPYNLLTLVFISFSWIILEENRIGILFIILSCVSIPHVINMHHLYKNFDFSKKNV